jgi:hypothetical protein
MSYNEDCAKIWNPTGPISFEVRMDPLGAGTFDVWAVQSGYARAVSSGWFKNRDDATELFLSKSYDQWMEALV